MKDPESSESQLRLVPSKASFSRAWRFHICHSFEEWHPESALAELKEQDASHWRQEGLDAQVIWARFEPFILHVACRSLQDAFELIDISRKAFPKSSLLSFRKRFVIQIPGEDYVDMPYFFSDPSFNASNWSGFSSYIDAVINDKFQMNSQRIAIFEDGLKVKR
eukprot:Skav226313  [mRNA]  locus=scaffold3301:570688:571179:- [translate_table: standard]